MSGWVTTEACPECGHGSTPPELNKVLGFYQNEDGETVGMRNYCMRCEHVWSS